MSHERKSGCCGCGCTPRYAYHGCTACNGLMCSDCAFDVGVEIDSEGYEEDLYVCKCCVVEYVKMRNTEQAAAVEAYLKEHPPRTDIKRNSDSAEYWPRTTACCVCEKELGDDYSQSCRECSDFCCSSCAFTCDWNTADFGDTYSLCPHCAKSNTDEVHAELAKLADKFAKKQ